VVPTWIKAAPFEGLSFCIQIFEVKFKKSGEKKNPGEKQSGTEKSKSCQKPVGIVCCGVVLLFRLEC
jgi:hypothetical protein